MTDAPEVTIQDKRQKRVFIALVCLGMFIAAILSWWVYRGVQENGFVFDSIPYLFGHENRLAALTWQNLVWMFTTLNMSNWHPLTWLSWAIDYQLYGGLEPAGFHLSSVVLHGLNSALVLLFMLALFGLNARPGAGWLWRNDHITLFAAFLIAVLFAVHPQHVESVAWVAERKDLLCQLFMLLSLLAYLNFASSAGRSRGTWYVLSFVAACLAAMSKPMAVSLPVVMLVLDLYPLGRLRFRSLKRFVGDLLRLLVEKAPFILLSAFLAIITLMAQEGAMVSVPLEIRILNAFHGYLAYLSKWVLPLTLSAHYPWFTTPELGIRPQHFIPMLGFVGITVLAIVLWLRNHRPPLAAWLVYVLSLVPVIGLVSVGLQGMADRYAYFPTLPLYFLTGGLLARAFRKGFAVKAGAAVGVMVFGAMMVLKTESQVGVWKSEATLWQSAARSFPRDATARTKFGVSLMRIGAYEPALGQFQIAAGLPDHSATVYAWRSYANVKLGRYTAAVEDHVQFADAAPLEPELVVNWPCVQFNLGWLHAQLGLRDKAIGFFDSVPEQSELGSDARTWARYLEAEERSAGDDPAVKLQGGFCPDLLPSPTEK